MQLIPWKRRPRYLAGAELAPATAIRRFRDEADRLFDRFLTRAREWPEEEMLAPFGDLVPSLDMTEDDKEITIRVEIPGIEAKDVDVSVSGNVLTISGEKRQATEQREANLYHCERTFGSFCRRLELPSTVDADTLDAELSSGILTVHAKKLAGARTRHVKVKGERREREPVMV